MAIDDLFPRIRTMGEVATPASSQLQEVININQHVYVLSTHHKGERCPERDYLAAKLRRVLTSHEAVDILLGGKPLTAWEFAHLWAMAIDLWPLMATGRCMEPEARLVLLTATSGEDVFPHSLYRVYGKVETLRMRSFVKTRISLYHGRQPHIGTVEEIVGRFFKPLMFLACVLISSQEEVGR